MSKKHENFESFLLRAHKAAYEQGPDEPGTSPGWIIRRFTHGKRQMATKRQAITVSANPYRVIYMELVFSGTDPNTKPEESIWHMMYNGHVIETARALGGLDTLGRCKFIQNLEYFLIQTLLANDEPAQMRGPAAFEDGDWVYVCEQKGDCFDFEGKETVLFKDEPVYQGTFKGRIRT